MEVTIGNGKELIQQAQAIRYQVFTLEQKIPQELDLDGLDEDSLHALVSEQGKPIATARLKVNQDGSSVMARVAVSEESRGLGIASKLVSALIEHAKNIGVRSIEIHAHSYLRSYYEKFGFKFIQEVEVVGEHQLIEMQYYIVEM
ncbi:GNAT family N-acetyltransferase [Vibrio diazotrophicus]|uniref:GNAT family N-acetyltransferase n=1 Tax=Vibrio diazotrophicus TaxID=685 RepID=A0A329EGZ6_VIBDI|nr:GNAT family N-acetyltransferase [Vibrio diazotrophicus]PNI03692.1 GNAT family N-acetyltransferase [Vibrio diazotrophicus]RAS69548.1 putative GNAT family N-acyltransferase [Vibrio diazotrophicus]